MLMKFSSLSPSHVSGSLWVSFLGLDHTWSHGPVYFGLSFSHFSALLWVAPEPPNRVQRLTSSFQRVPSGVETCRDLAGCS